MFKIEGMNGLPLRYENFNFENFNPETQEAAVGACQGYIHEHPQRRDLGIYFHGLPGSGKTHLAVATAQALLQANPNYYGPAEFVSVVHMVRTTKMMGVHNPHTPMNDCIEAGLLVLDDLGSEPHTPEIRDMLYTIIDSRYQTCSPTLITSTLDIVELEERYGDTFLGRVFGMCQPISLRGDDYRLLVSEAEWPGFGN